MATDRVKRSVVLNDETVEALEELKYLLRRNGSAVINQAVMALAETVKADNENKGIS